MPSINRIRVNNVKYNFGTQGYDDFSMRMYGRNTLYDLANGGGKSVLMLLLMQNLIPNCTLDDKQPIEKLFRDPGNTVIHSLIEWKLDECDIKDGMRYMTTGFAAKKAATTDEERADGTAQIEYFNYVIFYRDYNKNDIINLPLVKDNEHISYKALRNYLHDLSRNDKNLLVQIFDRKGEYQRFIADYGLYESQWEIIRGINRTEGHVRTYFESNYKTTRRVIEDLLIEEIIEKAYQTKTERDTNKTENTVSLLMTIQNELRELAEKKKGIELYDHEKELVQILIDRIESFMDLYAKKDEAAIECGRVYVTLEQEKEKREERFSELSAEKDNIQQELRDTGFILNILKILRDVEEAEKRKELKETREGELKDTEQKIELQKLAYNERAASAEYLILKKAKSEYEALKKDRKSTQSGNQDIYTVVANIRDRMDKLEEGLSKKLQPVEQETMELKKKKSSLEKENGEAETELAVIRSRQEYLRNDISELNKKLYNLENQSDFAGFYDAASYMDSLVKKSAEIEQALEKSSLRVNEIKDEKRDSIDRYEEESVELKSLKKQEEELLSDVNEYRKNASKYKSICSIYTDTSSADPTDVIEKISDRITGSVVRIYELKQKVDELEKKEKDIRSGRLIIPSEGTKKVLDYLQTRHGMGAMTGMDYISALPDDTKEELMKSIPGLPYGIIIQDIGSVIDDPGLTELDIDEEIILYDRNNLDEAAVVYGDGAMSVRRNREFFLEPKYLDMKLHVLGEELDNQREELRSNELMLETLREDLDFARLFAEKNYLNSESELERIRHRIRESEDRISDIRKQSDAIEKEERELEKNIAECKSGLEKNSQNIVIVEDIISLQTKINDISRQDNKLSDDKKRIENSLKDISEELKAISLRMTDLSMQLEEYKQSERDIKARWDNKYAAYYVDDTAFPYVEMDMPELEEAFERALGNSDFSHMSLEKEKLLADTLNSTIERETRAIRQLGIAVEELEKKDRDGSLLPSNEDILSMMKDELEGMLREKSRLEKEISGIENEVAKIEGSIEYADRLLNENYSCGFNEGLNSLEDKYREDVARSISHMEAVYESNKQRLKTAEEERDRFEKMSKNNDDLLRLASRIIKDSDIDKLKLTPLEDTDDIRQQFESLLINYDRLSKDIDRARADMMKVKMKVYDTLGSMGVAELAASIRDDVTIPSNKKEAGDLLKKLGDVVDIILLEKGRIEKSLVSMEQLKDNFVDQCIERCLDVRSELDKLTRLSEITMGDSKVQMIKLTIPYVKDEYIKSRMSEYIDRIVEEVDKKEDDNDRQKYLNSCLSMKKLFSVIVTDMSKIKLMLYKRERIKEQSRYLRYEEAVGSTGQSQGIYIQFLISIINYIAGMYATTDGAVRTKTLFIDNPFGAAKDIYIWEPIFKLLEENNCQLIVPARGATPEITGRFDINYVLGQQMTGNRTTTVVVSFSSKTKGEELEYKELDYEQQTFDFI